MVTPLKEQFASLDSAKDISTAPNPYSLISLPEISNSTIEKSVNGFLDHLSLVFSVKKADGSPGAPRGVFEDHW